MNSDEKPSKNDPPAPEVLKPQSDEASVVSPDAAKNIAKAKAARRIARHATYKPSHKATFIGLAIVVVIIALNVGIILFVINGANGEKDTKANNKEVVISSDVLDKLGVNKTSVDTTNTELIVGPNSKFNGKVTVGGDMNVAGGFNLNGKLSAAESSVVKLSAGETSLGQLVVNGNGTVTDFNVRDALVVAGSTTLQGPVSVSSLMTVNNNLNVVGSLAVGGTLSIRAFQTNTLTVGGKITTNGSAPGVSKGDALIATDTVSISGNDISGTVAVNIGVGSRSGIVAYVSFANSYGSTPHVVITPVGPGVSNYFINRNANGFSIGVGSIGTGGHAFDFIVMQ